MDKPLDTELRLLLDRNDELAEAQRQRDADLAALRSDWATIGRDFPNNIPEEEA